MYSEKNRPAAAAWAGRWAAGRAAAARARAAASRARLLREASYAAAAERFIAFLRGLPAVGWRTARSLEIGPGNSPHPGYEHLDVRGDLPHIEWVHDFNQPLPFEAGTFDEILSSHSIEHVSWRKVIGILKDWDHGRVLLEVNLQDPKRRLALLDVLKRELHIDLG